MANKRLIFLACNIYSILAAYSLDSYTRATEILKSKSVRSTDDVINVIWTCVWQSQIVMKTSDSSFSSKNVSDIDYFSNTLYELVQSIYGRGKKAKTCLSKFDIKFVVFVYF